jgi:hypothetical protein
MPGNKTDTSPTSATVTECSGSSNATLLSQELTQLPEVR